MKALKKLTVITDRARSRYGYNARGFAKALYDNNTIEIKKIASGAGYDKESAVLTMIVNEALGETKLNTFGAGFSSVMRALHELGFDIERTDLEKHTLYLITKK
ncbi:MAG: hypothetical protein IRZ03_18705 [Acidobacterium ailaaui]|nr:hypothetical protein [Pseudacidobacterium ailaaui]